MSGEIPVITITIDRMRKTLHHALLEEAVAHDALLRRVIDEEVTEKKMTEVIRGEIRRLLPEVIASLVRERIAGKAQAMVDDLLSAR